MSVLLHIAAIQDTVALAPRERRDAAALPAAEAFRVERGAVLVRRQDGPRELVLAVAAADCAVLAPTDEEELEALTHAELLPLHAGDPTAADSLVQALRDREESVSILALARHTDRVRAKLLQLARMHGKVVEGGVVIPLPLTHDLIAEMTASARETVTLALGELAEQGFVERVGRSYLLRVSPADLTGR